MQRPDCPRPFALPVSSATAYLKDLVMDCLAGAMFFLLFLFVIFRTMLVGPEEILFLFVARAFG